MAMVCAIAQAGNAGGALARPADCREAVVPFSGLTSWTTSFWLTLLRRTGPAST
jgi:hypothetical protein